MFFRRKKRTTHIEGETTLKEKQIVLTAFRRYVATFIKDTEELLNSPKKAKEKVMLDKFATDICSMYNLSLQMCHYDDASAETGHMLRRILYEPVFIGSSEKTIPLLEAAEFYLQNREEGEVFPQIIFEWTNFPDETKKFANDLRYLAIQL